MSLVEIEVVIHHGGRTDEVRLSLPPSTLVGEAVEAALRRCGLGPAGVSWSVRRGESRLADSRRIAD